MFQKNSTFWIFFDRNSPLLKSLLALFQGKKFIEAVDESSYHGANNLSIC